MLSSSFYVFIVHTFLNECLRLCRVLGIQMCLVNNSTHTAVHIPSIRWQHLLSQPCGVIGPILRRPEMERTLGNGLGYTNTPAYKHNTSPVHFGASLWVWLGGICTIMQSNAWSYWLASVLLCQPLSYDGDSSCVHCTWQWLLCPRIWWLICSVDDARLSFILHMHCHLFPSFLSFLPGSWPEKFIGRMKPGLGHN